MGRKIFVSYKYWDLDVADLPDYGDGCTKSRDYVTWIEVKLKERTEHIYKGESDDEDLSEYSDWYIEEKLKERMRDSSITIVLISPNMKEKYKHEKSQWIPWEIQYSIREVTQGNYTSRRNAILAVILPNANGSYEYYQNMRKFKILEENISCGYIPVCNWEQFKYKSEYWLNKAVEAKENTPSWMICKTV